MFLLNYLFTPKPVEASIIDSTADSIESSKVIFLLEDHDEGYHKLFQNRVLQQYADPEKDLLLLEESSSLTSAEIQETIHSRGTYKKNNFPRINIQGWNHADIPSLMDGVRNKEIYQSINRAIVTVGESFLKQYQYKEALPRAYTYLIKIARLRKGDPTLFSELEWESELEKGNYTSKMMYRIASELDKIMEDTRSDMILRGIHDAQQASLVENIKRYTESMSEGKIFVIAGHHHADTRANEVDIFREAARKVTSTLKANNISYVILFPENKKTWFNLL